MNKSVIVGSCIWVAVASGQAAFGQAPGLTPKATLRFVQSLGAPPTLSHKDIGNWAVMITAPPENAAVAELLLGMLQLARRDKIASLDVPNGNDLDAPKLIPTNVSGIVLHGGNAFNRRLEQLLGECFLVRQTDVVPDTLHDWAPKKGLPADRWTPVWIEIGKGSPYKSPYPCE